MDAKKKKIVIIIGIVVLIAVIGIIIYTNSTGYTRQQKIRSVQNDLTEYRQEQAPLTFFIEDEWMEDAEFQDFLISKVQEMYENDEIYLLREFLKRLEFDDLRYSFLLDAVTNGFDNLKTLEDCFNVLDILQYLDYYNSQFELHRDSMLFTSYFSENGPRTITTTPGEGYYADKEDTSSRKTVGIEGSPLYEAKSETYMGDFACYHEFGVKLNSYYEETSYSNTRYAFRGNGISFSPDSGECIWAGDYLFCFSQSGGLIGYQKIE